MFETIREIEIEKLKAEKEIEVKALKDEMEVRNISLSEEIFTLNTWRISTSDHLYKMHLCLSFIFNFSFISTHDV
jgi:hypothetical protein